METFENPLTKLAMRARKKFSKKSDVEKETSRPPRIDAEYIYKKYNPEREISEFKKKVGRIRAENEDVQNPIGQLIDRRIYEKLNEIEKDRYVNKIVNMYNRVIE